MRNALLIPPMWLLAALAGCSAEFSGPGAAQSLARAKDAQASAGLPVYGLDRPRERGCRSSGFRGFDFWVGRWDVYGAGDGAVQVGTNLVTRELEGCAVEEHWTDSLGGRGRSLNTYDAGTKEWNQLWMDSNGLALIFSGSATKGGMVLLGDTPQGAGGPIVTNRGTWTELQGGRRVRQLFEASTDNRQTWTTQFDGDYRRRDRISPAAEVLNSFCASPARVRFHWFDFLLGTWQVRRGSAQGDVVGTLAVTKDVSDCLIVSDFVQKGYRGRAFSAFHFPTLTWHRTWIDADGVRIDLAGGLVNGAMVMTGQRVSGNLTRDLRVTWQPVSPTQVDELWETSLDGGATWSTAWTFVLTP